MIASQITGIANSSLLCSSFELMESAHHFLPSLQVWYWITYGLVPHKGTYTSSQLLLLPEQQSGSGVILQIQPMPTPRLLHSMMLYESLNRSTLTCQSIIRQIHNLVSPISFNNSLNVPEKRMKDLSTLYLIWIALVEQYGLPNSSTLDQSFVELPNSLCPENTAISSS